ISITSTSGSVSVVQIGNQGFNTALAASGNISVGDIDSPAAAALGGFGGPTSPTAGNGGTVMLTSTGGSVNVNGGIYTQLNDQTTSGTGGPVTINANQAANVSNGIVSGALGASTTGAAGGPVNVTAGTGIALGL